MDINPESEPQHDHATERVAPAALPESANPRRYIPFALLGAMTAGVGIAAYIAVRDNSTPSQAVASALTNSLKFKSAALSISIGISEPGGTATIKSQGGTNFDTGATNETLQIIGGNQRIGEHIVSDGSKIYVHLDGGVIAKVVGGKSWVSVPSGQSTASSTPVGGGAGNSSAILRVLSATGDNVSDLGPSRVNGATVHLYSVHLTRSQIKRNLAQERLPRFMRQDTAGLNIPPITYTLAIDSANQLAQLKGIVHLKAEGQTIAEHLVENYAHYGTKVSVTTPPPNEVIPLQTFLQIAAEKGANVTI
jgi:hypothetical protein